MINVAIDGPAGAGKSTVARGAAKQLGYIYVDTGALYRTVALSAVRCGALGDSEKIENMLKNITVNLAFDDSGAQCVYLNGEDVSSLMFQKSRLFVHSCSAYSVILPKITMLLWTAGI